MFPILVWIVTHSRMDDIHMRLGFLDRFLDEGIKFFGEVGICLSLVQAAAEFVRMKDKDGDELHVENTESKEDE